jgi:hypothetical protein
MLDPTYDYNAFGSAIEFNAPLRYTNQAASCGVRDALQASEQLRARPGSTAETR